MNTSPFSDHLRWPSNTLFCSMKSTMLNYNITITMDNNNDDDDDDGDDDDNVLRWCQQIIFDT